MNSTWKRISALVLTMVMVFGMLPVSAFAEEHIHSYESTVTDPTCEAAGYTTYACSCGDSYTSDEVAALGHSYEAVVTAPTCEAAGYTTYTCSCGDSYTSDEVAALGHSYAEGVCSVCGAAEHTHSYEAVVTAPTCEAAGYTTYTCGCGDSYTSDEVEALGHSYAEGACSVCGTEEPEKEPEVDEQVQNVQAMINALRTTINEGEEAAAYAEYQAAEAAIGALTDEQRAQLDLTNFYAAAMPTVIPEDDGINTWVELKAELVDGANITLTGDITTEEAIVLSGVTATLDLGGKTLTIGKGDNKFNDETNLTIKNGNIVITGVTVGGNAIFCLDEYEKTLKTKLTLNDVNLSGNGYSSAYGVFYIGASSELNVIGGTWNLANDTYTSGGVFKADDSGATLNISGLNLTAHNVRRVVTYANTTIEDSTMAISGDADGVDAEMEHGFNRSPLTIKNSTVTMKNMVGRGITAQNGDVSIENSTVTMENVQEATIEVKANTVTISDDSTVTIDKAPTVASGAAISGAVSRSATGKFNGGMVNMENVDRTFLTLDFSNVYANESIVIKIYDTNDTLLVTTALSEAKKTEILKKDFGGFSSFVGINCTDAYWETQWEEDKLRADYVPAYGVLYIDDIEQNSAEIKMIRTSGEGAVDWAKVPGVKAAPTLTNVYTRADGFWGEGGATSDESFVVELYEGETKIASAALNNVGGIIDGDLYVTWSIPFAGSNDEYWTVEWAAGYPKYDMNPTKGVLVSDGEVVAESPVKYNAPDDLNKIVALAEGFTGGVIAYTNLTDAIGNFNGRKVNVLRDVTESIDGFCGVTLTTNVEGGVTIASTYDDWVDFDDVTIGKGVTVNIPNVYSGDSENVIEGTLNVGETYYHGYDAKTTVQNGGKITVGDSTILRYNESADAGLYIYGDGDHSTVEFDCNYYIGAYSGTFYAENATIETGYFLLKNSYDNENYADIDMTLNNSKLTVVGTGDGQDSFIIDDQASLTLNNGSAIADVRDFNIMEGTDLTLSVDETSSISATYVNIAEDVPLSGTVNADGTVTFERKLQGTGTAEDPFLISCLEDLIQFRDNVDQQLSDGSSQYAGQYFKLTADIDMSGINWNPIGSMSGDHGSFKGVFDGNGHTISNLNVQQAGNGLGLFARTAGNAEIKNLTLNNVTVKSTDNSNYVGGVVGNSYASTKISNVHVTGEIDISGRGYIGGISGHGYVVMDNVSVQGEGTISSTFWCAGGILGYGGEGTTNISNASVVGTGSGLTITSAAGGLGAIVGMAEDNDGTQPISGSNLSASNVDIKTYTGAYGDAYANYALGYLYGGNPTSQLSGNLSVSDVSITTSNGVEPEINDAVATIGGSIYFDLQTAVNAADGKTVTLLRDVTTAGVNIPDGKTITIDLNEKTLNGSILAPNANLTVENGSIKNTNSNVSAIEINAGTLTLNDVDIDSARHAVRIDGAVNATIDGGTYRSAIGDTAGTYHAVNVSGAANVTIKDGTFVGPNGTAADSGAAVNVQKNAKVTIQNGSFSGGKNDTLAADGTLELFGGVYDQDPGAYCVDGFAAKNNGNGTWTVTVAGAAVITEDETLYYYSLAEAAEAAANMQNNGVKVNGVMATNNAYKNDAEEDITVTGPMSITSLGMDGKLGVILDGNDSATVKKNGTIELKSGADADTGYGSYMTLVFDRKTEKVTDQMVFVEPETVLTINANTNEFGDNEFAGEYMKDRNGDDKLTKADFDVYFPLYDNSYDVGSDETLVVESTGFFGSCVRIFVDDIEVYDRDDQYIKTGVSVKPGCTRLEMTSTFLKTLSSGTHEVTFVHKLGNETFRVTDNFTVIAKTSTSYPDPTNPKTGDSIFMAVSVMTFSAAALAVLLMGKKYNKV